MSALAERRRTARRALGPVGTACVVAVAVLSTYALVVGPSLDHLRTRVGRDWPFVALAVAGVVTQTVVARRKLTRRRSGIATGLLALAVGVAATAALGDGHSLSDFEPSTGTPIFATPSLPGVVSAAAIVVLLLAAWMTARPETHRQRVALASQRTIDGSAS